jgi:hypothetical protein
MQIGTSVEKCGLSEYDISLRISAVVEESQGENDKIYIHHQACTANTTMPSGAHT